MAHPRHEDVRRRFQGCCGYCGVSENDVGGELTVDHYLPLHAGGGDSEENLIYCCFRCNLYKGNFAPTSTDRANGLTVLHPTQDKFDEHLRLDKSTGYFEALTPTGGFHLNLLRLNRPELVTHRLRRRAAELGEARRRLLEAEISELRAIISAQERYVSHLRKLVDDDPAPGG